MNFKRMPIEIESPEQRGYDSIKYNLAESSVTDQILNLKDLSLEKVITCYGHHAGHTQLRSLIAKNLCLKEENILLTAGAAAGLFIVSTSILNTGDSILVQHPNYGTNYETPRAIGVDVVKINLTIENNWDYDLNEIKALLKLKPNIKLISITNPHNPTGKVFEEEKINQLISLAEEKNIYLLIDETYGDLWFDDKPKPNYVIKSEKVIIVSSLSKAYGLPGIRIGWIATRNALLNELFLAAKEQIFICNSVVDEEIAFRFYKQMPAWFSNYKNQILEKRKITLQWMNINKNIVDFLEPKGGVVCFLKLKNLDTVQVEKFYERLNNIYETYVGPGHWFEMDKSFFRLGYGWPGIGELEIGLSNITKTYSEIQQK